MIELVVSSSVSVPSSSASTSFSTSVTANFFEVAAAVRAASVFQNATSSTSPAGGVAALTRKRSRRSDAAGVSWAVGAATRVSPPSR